MYIALHESGAATKPDGDLDLVEDVVEHIKLVIGCRARSYLYDTDLGTYLLTHNIKRVYIAGGALMKGDISDVDLFPAPQYYSEFIGLIDRLGGDQLAEIKIDDLNVQFCRQKTEGPVCDLVAGFDFAHCQVGVDLGYDSDEGEWIVNNVAVTNNYIAAMAVQGTFYTGGKWPLRSLARIPKVASKLRLSKLETQALAFQVTAHIAKTGLKELIEEDGKFASTLGLVKD